MNTKTKVEGAIWWLKCSNCAVEFPVFVFSGDSDIATDSFRTSTDLIAKSIFIYHCSVQCPGGSEVRLMEVVREKSCPGEGFQEYKNRQANADARHFYKCISCDVGRAEAVKMLSEHELHSKGYALINMLSTKHENL